MSAIGIVKLMSVWPSVEVFCTIMSTLTLAAASGSNSAAETPGRSGTPSTVTFASLTSVTTPEMIGSSIAGSSKVTHVPGSQVKLERTWRGTLWLRANSTERRASTLRAGAGHLEHLVEVDLGELAGLRHDARVGREHAGHVGVDLARVGAEGGGERHRGGVGAAPPERRDLVLDRDALEAGDDADLAGGERLADPIALDLEDLGLAVCRVGDDPDLAAGEALGVDAEVGERHAQQRHRHPLAGGQQHVHLAARQRLRDVVGELDQVVGRLAHRRHDDHDVVAVPLA